MTTPSRRTSLSNEFGTASCTWYGPVPGTILVSKYVLGAVSLPHPVLQDILGDPDVAPELYDRSQEVVEWRG